MVYNKIVIYMWGRFLKKADKVLLRIEQKGYDVANKAHVYTINFILLGLGYGMYTFLRDYNEFFIQIRVSPLNNCRLLLWNTAWTRTSCPSWTRMTTDTDHYII